VINRCDKSLEWIPSSLSHEKYKIESITIITKCDKDIEGLRSVYKMDTLGIIDELLIIIGRCNYFYAHYISSELSRDAIDRQKHGNDTVIFLKDNNNYLLRQGPKDYHGPFLNSLTLHRLSILDASKLGGITFFHFRCMIMIFWNRILWKVIKGLEMIEMRMRNF